MDTVTTPAHTASTADEQPPSPEPATPPPGKPSVDAILASVQTSHSAAEAADRAMQEAEAAVTDAVANMNVGDS